MSRQFSLAYLTTPGIDPVEQIKIAARAGYDYVSLRTIPMGQEGEPQVHLEQDPDLTEKIRQTLKERGMKLFDIELVRIREDLPADYRAAFEKGAELGATQVLTSVWTKDRALAADRCGAFCEQAAQFGLTLNLEFPIVSQLTSMREALELQDRKPRSDAKMYQLPKDIQRGVHERLIDCNMSYADIRAWLAEKGYKVSQASLSRYSFKVFEAAERIADDLEKTKAVVDFIGRNPDLDTTEVRRT